MAELPDWTPFDPSAPPALPQVEEGSGRVVVVVATYVASTLGWSGRVTADLAAGWSASGHRVVLADAGLVEPQLHDVFGEANAEGIADTVAFGASVRRVARPVRDGAYFLITAGTAVSEPESVVRSARWARLCGGFQRAGVTLVVFVSPDEPAFEWALEAASDVVVLAGPDEDVRSLVDGVGDLVRAVTGVGGASAAAQGDTPEDPDPAGAIGSFSVEEAWDAGDPEPAEPDGASLDQDPVEGGSEAAALVDAAPAPEPLDPTPADTAAPAAAEEPRDGLDPPGEPPVATEEPGDGAPGAPLDDDQILPGWAEAAKQQVALGDDASLRKPKTEAEEVERKNRSVLVLMLILLAIVAAAVVGLVQIPGLSPDGSDSEAAPEGEAPAARSVPQPETTSLLGFSVTAGAFRDPAVARARGGQLSVETDGFVVLAPIQVDGDVFHRLQMGPAGDSAEAAALAGRLRAAGAAASELLVRPTPLAYQLGELGELDAASRRAEVLQGLDVPAYVLEVEYGDGAVRYRVYAGAYATEQEAAYLGTLLADRGLDAAVLTQRTGRLPE